MRGEEPAGPKRGGAIIIGEASAGAAEAEGAVKSGSPPPIDPSKLPKD